MSEEKWTKGDWSVRDCPMKGARTATKDNGRIKLIDYNDGEHEGTLAIVQTECSQANAHLIAAAPELYEALHILTNIQECCDETGYIDGEGFVNVESALESAHAALAKARGES